MLLDTYLFAKCSAEFGDNSRNQLLAMQPGQVPKGCCVAECITNVTHTYQGNGALDKLSLTRIFLNSIRGNQIWGDIVTKAVDFCFQESKKNDYRRRYQ